MVQISAVCQRFDFNTLGSDFFLFGLSLLSAFSFTADIFVFSVIFVFFVFIIFMNPFFGGVGFAFSLLLLLFLPLPESHQGLNGILLNSKFELSISHST